MTQYVWCNKAEQFRYAGVCKKLGCNHLVSHDDDEGYECHFVNAEGKRAKKADRIEKKKDIEEDARDYRTGASREEEDDGIDEAV